MTRDSQRGKLYRADGFDGARFADVAEVQKHVERLTSTDAYTDRHGNGVWKSGIRVVGVPDRGNTPARGYRFEREGRLTGGRIELPPWALREDVVLHELAHVGTPRAFANHGIEFAREYLWLVETFVGPLTAASVREKFDRRGVRYDYDARHPERIVGRVMRTIMEARGLTRRDPAWRRRGTPYVTLSLVLRDGTRVTDTFRLAPGYRELVAHDPRGADARPRVVDVEDVALIR